MDFETETYKEVMNQINGYEEMISDDIAAPIRENKAALNKLTGSLHCITIANTVPYFSHNANNIKEIVHQRLF